MNVSQGSIVSFNCTVAEIPEDQFWQVNGKALNHVNNINRGITTKKENELTYIATVPATLTNDDMTVQCILLTVEEVIASQEARLRIQGV